MTREISSHAMQLIVPTPVGHLSIIHAGPRVLASGWDVERDKQLRLIHPTIRPAVVEPVDSDPYELAGRVHAFFDGDVAAVGGIETYQVGGAFTQQAWEAIREIPPGETASYAEVAAMAGNPMAFRAAASACAKNACALIIPCHRVVKSDGTQGGFRYGLTIKTQLLSVESAHT